MRRVGVLLSGLLEAAYGPLADPADDAGQRLRKSIMMVALGAGIVVTLASALGQAAAGFERAALVLFGYEALLLAGLAFILVTRRGIDVVLFVLLAFNLVISAGIPMLSGGVLLTGPNVAWGIAPPVLALLLYGRRTALYWFAAYLVVLGLAIFGPSVAPAEQPGRTVLLVSFATSLVGVSVFLFGMFVYFVGERDKAQAAAERERARSDALLRNILPDEIVTVLRSRPGTIADHYERASVLFADIADFTPMSARLTAADLVALLNEVFSEFDRLVDRHGVEKIKTIGDCYMVAAGVPVPRDDHATILARMALEMRDLVDRRDFGGHRLRFRMGIHSGPLVAGVIGERKFIYDLWGDTVNIASRMESQGVIGRIQVTEDTHRLLTGRFRFTDRGFLSVKGKGDVHVYLLDGEGT